MKVKHLLMTAGGAMLAHSLALAPPAGAGEPVRFAVFADPHYYDTNLGTTGPAFEAYLASDRKMLRESGAILESAISAIKAENPDFVIVSGDLTKDGERTSHEKFAASIRDLEAQGIQVYVIPGNHDVLNPHAVSFNGAGTTPVPGVTPAEFKDIYAEFGYSEAVAKDPNSLSYVVEPVPGTRIIAIDSCIYEDNLTLGHPVTGGRLAGDRLEWVLDQARLARAQGKNVIATLHHGVREHFMGQASQFPEYVVEDQDEVSRAMGLAGIKVVFTGHFHANDITSGRLYDDGRPVEIVDVETGSLVTYPSPFRIVELDRDGVMSIRTSHVEDISYDTNGLTFPEYARNFLDTGLYGIVFYTITQPPHLGGFGLDPADPNTAHISRQFTDAFTAHYSGDETPDAITLQTINYYLQSANPVVNILGQYLSALWTDLPPADSNTTFNAWTAPVASHAIKLTHLGTYESGIFDEGAAEIVAHDPESQRLFIVNGEDDSVDVLDASQPEVLTKLFSIDLSSTGSGPTSVAVRNGIVAVAVPADHKQDPGKVLFFDTNGSPKGEVTVGALPDMLTFTPDGKHILVANEGEPNDEYTEDPEGSVSVIDISRGVGRARVKTASFRHFNKKIDSLRAQGVRIFGPGATVAMDLEPEYIAVSADSKTAWVTLQENNAMALLHIQSARILKIMPLGYKDHGETGIDASDKDGGINIRSYADLRGMYQPDAVASFSRCGKTYLVTANEGDARDYDAFSEEKRVKKLVLDPSLPAEYKNDEKLGRLQVTSTLGDLDGDGDHDVLYAFGARSFSIWRADPWGLKQVFDSGDALEKIIATYHPQFFNSDNDKNSFDARSDNKGPEPEGVAIGVVKNHTFAFVGLERIGGIVVYDVTRPKRPEFVGYFNNRDFAGDPEAGTAGDLGPEGLAFIDAEDSPTGHPLLAVGNEVSGTTSIFQIDDRNLGIFGDINGDGRVNWSDLAALKKHMGMDANACPDCDMDGDVHITPHDVACMVHLIRGGSSR